jgi:hypothetical protein
MRHVCGSANLTSPTLIFCVCIEQIQFFLQQYIKQTDSLTSHLFLQLFKNLPFFVEFKIVITNVEQSVLRRAFFFKRLRLQFRKKGSYPLAYSTVYGAKVKKIT